MKTLLSKQWEDHPMLKRFEQKIDQWAYPAQQRLLALNFAPLRYLISMALTQAIPKALPKELESLQKRYDNLLKKDLENVQSGYYPRALLYQIPLLDYLPRIPQLMGDMLNIVHRARNKRHDDLPATIQHKNYPAYYTRNFHWQSDGYFSQHSAQVYDASVELLFLGTADVMRRQTIPAITRYIQQRNQTEPGLTPPQLSLLDVACGTGRSILQIATAHPSLEYTGLDLSPDYLQEARHVLSTVDKVSLIEANAEAIPMSAEQVDIVSCVYLFHELPRDVRRQILAEMFRVLKPGGLLVLTDSCQLSDSPDIAETLARFPQEYHEPYYKDYLRDDLAQALFQTGFTPPDISLHYISKLFVARKPD